MKSFEVFGNPTSSSHQTNQDGHAMEDEAAERKRIQERDARQKAAVIRYVNIANEKRRREEEQR